MKKLFTFFSLFGSMSTLLCCALPVTLVSLGMGASFAALTSNVPQLIWLVERKNALFIITGFLLVLSYYLIRKSQNLACPVDMDQREVCQSSRNYTKIIYFISLALYAIGGVFSFIIPLFYT